MASDPLAAPSGAAAQPKKWSSSRLSEKQFALLLILPLIIVLTAVVAYPLGYSIWMSLQRIDLIFNTTESVGLQNYRDAIASQEIRHAFRITIYYTILVSLFSVAASIGGAVKA